MTIFTLSTFHALIIGFFFFEGTLHKPTMSLSTLNVKRNGRVYAHKLIFNENYY